MATLIDGELDAWIAEHVMGWTPKGYQLSAYWFDGAEHIAGEVFTDGSEPDSKFRHFSFCHDLNFSAQAEAKVRDMNLEQDYLLNLGVATVGYRFHDRPDCDEFAAAVFATARQRCQAMYGIREQIEKARAG